jgi:hypothetical protein
VIFATATVTFSGHTARPIVTNVIDPTNPIPCVNPDGSLVDSCFAIPNGGAATFTVEVHDLYNPLIAGSTVAVTANDTDAILGQITLLDGQSFNQLVDGLTRFTFILKDPNPFDTNLPTNSLIEVKVNSENDSGDFVVGQGTVD